MKAGILLAGLALAAGTGWWVVNDAGSARNLTITEIVAKPLEDGTLVSVFAIENAGAPDRLLSVSSPATQAALYSPVAEAGVPVPSGTGSLALDAAHVQLAATPFEDGALVPLILKFENAGEVSVKARLSDPARQGDASEVGLFGLGDICVVEDGEPAPQLALDVTPEGDGWRVSIRTEDFTFSDQYTGLYHVPGMGHGHLYVGGMKIGRLYEPTALIGALPPGRHEIRVTLNTNDHRAYVVDDEPASASAMVQVD